MSKRAFFFQLSGVTAAVLLLLFGIHLFPSITPYWDFSLISLLLFVGISLVLFFAGQQAANSTNKTLFTAVTIAFIFGKLLLSVLLVLGYLKWREPPSRVILAPFFVVYLCYTVFETYFLMRIGRTKPNSDN